MRLVSRNSFRFCRAQAYLQRFKDLEDEVNRREREVIQKQERLVRLRELSYFTNQDRLQKYLSVFFTDKPFESEAVRKQREQYTSLRDMLIQVQSDGKSRADIAKRLAQQQKLNREKNFLIDMARFSNKFHRTSQLKIFNPEVKLGLELSSKNIDHKLQKEGVEFLGSKDQKFNKQIHQKVDGQGEMIKEMLQRGIKTRGTLVSKAKIHSKVA